jgi:hypothetical protein
MTVTSTTSSDVYLALIGLAGVVVGAAIKAVGDYVDYLHRRKADLRLAALKCLDRLEKLKPLRKEIVSAKGSKFNYEDLPDSEPTKKKINDELWLLGGDLDVYLSALIEARQRDRERYFECYRQMRPLVIDHNLAVLDAEPLFVNLRLLAKINTGDEVSGA